MYPKLVKVGSATVHIYRVPHASTASGFAFTVGWTDEQGAQRRMQRADEQKALFLARDIAGKISAGKSMATHFGPQDREELLALRNLVKPHGVPVLSALKEWSRANELCPGRILAACEMYAQREGTAKAKAILVPLVVQAFIEDLNADGKRATLTYGSKLGAVSKAFALRELHSITAEEWTAYLRTFATKSTRNDRRKRIITLCIWARRKGYLPKHGELEIELTNSVNEGSTTISILTPKEFAVLLEFFRLHFPQYLAGLVLAGFCGLRSAEVGGKEEFAEPRQRWSHIHLGKKMLKVTSAKTNTPASRLVPMSEAAVQWLKLCPQDKDDPYCVPWRCFEYAHRLSTRRNLNWPKNALRHSFISYRVPYVKSKPQVALEAGTSVAKIDSNYRFPLTEEDGEEWFSLTPARCAEIVASLPLPEAQNVWNEMTV